MNLDKWSKDRTMTQPRARHSRDKAERVKNIKKQLPFMSVLMSLFQPRVNIHNEFNYLFQFLRSTLFVLFKENEASVINFESNTPVGKILLVCFIIYQRTVNYIF